MLNSSFVALKIIHFIVYRSLRQAVELFITALFCQSLMKWMLSLAVKYLMHHVSLQVFRLLPFPFKFQDCVLFFFVKTRDTISSENATFSSKLFSFNIFFIINHSTSIATSWHGIIRVWTSWIGIVTAFKVKTKNLVKL